MLPFTKDQFFDVFAAYNGTLWPAVAALWLASAAVSVLLLLSRRPRDRWVSALLAAHWVWSAVAYHATFFTRINDAAWLFSLLFLGQGALFVWIGLWQGQLSFARGHGAWASVAWVLIAYSLAYPVINVIHHVSLSRVPLFAVPCPTTIFTTGLLMLAPPSWRLGIIPIIWSAIGGSAAVLLNVSADYALPAAGIALAIYAADGARHRAGAASDRRRAAA